MKNYHNAALKSDNRIHAFKCGMITYKEWIAFIESDKQKVCDWCSESFADSDDENSRCQECRKE
jgi:hypothetical protein